MKRSYKVLLLTMLVFIFSTSVVFAAEVEPAVNANKFGLWTLLPPLVAIILAFITKKCCYFIVYRYFIRKLFN